MQIKKDISLLMLLALLFAALLINARTNQRPVPVVSTGGASPECRIMTETNRSISPLNFITKGIFHFS